MKRFLFFLARLAIIIGFVIAIVSFATYSLNKQVSYEHLEDMQSFLEHNSSYFWALRYTLFSIGGLFWYLTYRNIVKFNLHDAKAPYFRITAMLIVVVVLYELSLYF